MKEIASRKNENCKRWLSLQSAKGIKKHGQFLISGEKLVKEALDSQSQSIAEVLIAKKHKDLDIDSSDTIDKIVLDTLIFQEIDSLNTDFPILVMNTFEIPDWSQRAKPGMTVLVPVGDPANLGALIRSAEAFSATEVVLLEEACTPFLPKAVRAASGSLFRASISRGPSIAQLSTQENWYSLGLDGTSLDEIQFNDSTVVLLGEEGVGLQNAPKMPQIKIPMNPQSESLNATVAASVLLYEFEKQKRRHPGKTG